AAVVIGTIAGLRGSVHLFGRVWPGSTVAGTCRITRTLEPWRVDEGRIDVSATPEHVLVSADTPSGAPRFGYATKNDVRLTEWQDPQTSQLFPPDAVTYSCAGVVGDRVAGSAVENLRDHATFHVFDVTDKIDGIGTPSSAQVYPHHSQKVRCAHS